MSHFLKNHSKSIYFIEVDSEEFEEIDDCREIRTVPTFLFFYNQQIIDTVVGTDIKKIEARTKRNLEKIDNSIFPKIDIDEIDKTN